MSLPLRRILIADDHEAIRRGLKSFVETRPEWRVVAEASDGRQALELARQTRPDIAILDYSLPLMNGLDLTRAIKHDFPRTEILIFTMHDREDIVTAVLRAGARAYVLKSDSEQHLLAALDALAIGRPYFSCEVSETLLEYFIDHGNKTAKQGILTQREREIVQLIAEGKINKEISHLLGISVKTVETHRAAAMHKLKIKTTAELVRYAVRNNIVQP